MASDTDEWKPALVLPNVDMRGSIECQHAAIVAPSDTRIQRLRDAHPNLTTFMSKFCGQFGDQVWPSFLLLRSQSPKSYYTAEAVSAFRDVIALSVIPYARTNRLRFRRSSYLAYTNIFQFYPWMLGADYEGMILINPAQTHMHVLEEFEGQSFPEQSQTTVMGHDIDFPLARELLNRWVSRFSEAAVTWNDRALFRSLNMANEAGRMPAMTAATFYDTGRSLALWVSAYEILAHPGGTGQSNFDTVSATLEKVKWVDERLSHIAYTLPGRTPRRAQLATWICRKIYDLRNAFLHGNDVDGKQLLLSGNPAIDFAACLYRFALTGFLDLHFNLPVPSGDDAEAVGDYINKRGGFNRFQRAYESALVTACP